jgi:glycosyltransferase involved in cell wall biosynthesis
MISVVIPSYNRAGTIKRAVDSVLNQTYPDIEVIVVDDGSTDNTKTVLSEISDKRFRYIYQENAGACAARNNGIKHAIGEYIAFQDSDDAWRPEKLERQLKTMQQYNADICFCRMERHNYPEGKDRFYPDIPEGIVQYEDLLLRSLASTQTIIAKKEVYNSAMFDVNVKRMQDYDWMIRAAKNHRVCFTNAVLVDLYLQND